MVWIIMVVGLFFLLHCSKQIILKNTLQVEEVENCRVYGKPTRDLAVSRYFSIMYLNVQFMAGKFKHVPDHDSEPYRFWFDEEDESGPDLKPLLMDIKRTIKEIALFIKNRKLDIVCLGEVDDGADRTYRLNQAMLLFKELEGEGYCYSEAFYWRANYVPHSKIRGCVGMKLVTLSRFPIKYARRYQLPLVPRNWLFQQFYPKRAVLVTYIPIDQYKSLAILNTHLSAFVKGTKVKRTEVLYVKNLIKELEEAGYKVILIGDLNLLPPWKYNSIVEQERYLYSPETELTELFDYQIIPSLKDINGLGAEKYFTYWPNSKYVNSKLVKEAWDRTIDFGIFSKSIKIEDYQVAQVVLSDHRPIVVQCRV